MRPASLIFFILYFAVGILLLNISFNFISGVNNITILNNLIIIFGGVLCILGGINHFRLGQIRRFQRRVART